MTTWNLVLVGFGHVARRFVELLTERRDRLRATYGITCRIVGIATLRHGSVFADTGVDADRALRLLTAGRWLDPGALGLPATAACTSAFGVLSRASGLDAGVMVETTTLQVTSGEPAASHVRAALRGGLHVISANKGPVACAYRELDALARSAGRQFRFEGAVMDGVPVFNLVRETLRGVEILGFRGVLNSTTNYILCEMGRGVAFAEALARMQADGIADADASLDVDGWDAAAKTAALVNVIMGGELTPAGVDRTGIAHLTAEDVQSAARRGHRLRLVATASRGPDGITARVAPTEVPLDDPLAQLEGMANALALRTDLLGEIVITQRDGGLTQTAYALLSDLLSLPVPPRGPAAGPPRRTP